ncbi:MAG: hypothetical protein ABR601_03530 [Parasphingopyxis sp.]|nr:hypothetical protein [Sphingomonadales bacterium]
MASRGANLDGSSPATGERARHRGFLAYRDMFWGKIALAILLLLVVTYLLVDVAPRPNGGSWYGYTLGTVGALLIVWLALLGVRKRAMTPGRWSLKAWVSAHVYLGLALAAIGTFHAGFQLGWNVHTLAWALMMLVILSGLFGVAAYAGLPRILSRNRDEATEEDMLATLHDIDRRLFDAAQPLDAETALRIDEAIAEDPFRGRLFHRLRGRYRGGGTAAAVEAVRARARSGADPMDDVLDRIEGLLARRQAAMARIRRHLRYKSILQIWLYIHVPMTFALIAALSAHIVSVFFYW